jgi:hypothetical protein
MADKPTTWGTRAAAREAADRLPRPYGQSGIGIEFGDLGEGISLGGIDLDTACEPGAALAPWAVKVVDLFGSYVETSPSLTGAKARGLIARRRREAQARMGEAMEARRR